MKCVTPSLEFLREWGLQILITGLAVLVLVGMDYTVISDPFRDGKIRYLLIAFAVCQAMSMWKIHPAWALFAAWNSIRWITADFPAHGVVEVLAVPACALVGAWWDRSCRQVPKVIAAMALLQCVYGMVQMTGWDPFMSVEQAFVGKPIGTLGHYTMIGPFIALGAMYFLQRVRDWRMLALFVLMSMGVVLTGSTMSILALGAGFLYTAWRKEPATAYGVMALCLMAVGTAYLFRPDAEFFSLTGRQLAWPHGIDAWLAAPLFGHGPGAWSAYLNGPLNQASGMSWPQLHNDFLQLLVEHGVIGFGIVAVGLAMFFRKAQRLCPFYGSAAVVLCTNALGNFPMHMACFGLVAGWLAVRVHTMEEPGR